MGKNVGGILSFTLLSEEGFDGGGNDATGQQKSHGKYFWMKEACT